jgi:hypothetical protein
MKKIKITVKTKDIDSGYFPYDFPSSVLKSMNWKTACFRANETIMCGEKVLFEKGEIIPFYSQTVMWGEEPKGVVLQLKKEGFDFKNYISNNQFSINFEYEKLTKKQKEKNKTTKSTTLSQSPDKKVKSNIINLLNSSNKKHYFSEKTDNIENLLNQIDYSLIICSPKLAKKYNITPIISSFFSDDIILCVKKDMSTEIIHIK